MSQDRREVKYDKIIKYEENIHEKNQIRIKLGIQMLIIIPLIFLAIMFKMESNKIVFLTLWIVSLFIISVYLIVVEYLDYQLQVKLHEFGLREEAPVQGLIKEESRIEDVIMNAVMLDEQLQEKRLALEEKKNEDRDIVIDGMKELQPGYVEGNRAVDEMINELVQQQVEKEMAEWISRQQGEDAEDDKKVHSVNVEEMKAKHKKAADKRNAQKNVEQHTGRTLTMTEDEMVEHFRNYLAMINTQDSDSEE